MKKLLHRAFEAHRTMLVRRILAIADKPRDSEKDEKKLKRLTARLKVVNLKLGVIK